MDDKPEFQQIKIEIPEIAKGTTIPHGVQRFIELEEARKKAERKATLYFWGGVASTVVFSIISVIAGYLLSKYC